MNALVSVRFTLDIPEARIKSIMGRPDDGSDAYHYDATHKVEEWVRDNLPDALELATDEPDVDGS